MEAIQIFQTANIANITNIFGSISASRGASMFTKTSAIIPVNTSIGENEKYLTSQIITYLGNKRSLLDFIGNGVEKVQKKLGKEKLSIFDVFSGSGIVSRFFRQYASSMISNDLEKYSYIINSCYLSNSTERDLVLLRGIFCQLKEELECCYLSDEWQKGIISSQYAPQDDKNIKKGERVFYTTRNANYIDTARSLIETYPEHTQNFFLAPLLAAASVHVNTSGVFKGFHKNNETGLGQFGGKNQNALNRITGNIDIKFPLFSNFDCETRVIQGDANEIINSVEEVDLAYIDPPYNQHPYGSNYFMLNVIAENCEPLKPSKISGITSDWNRSAYNKAHEAETALQDLIEKVKAKFVLLSFNSEGFMTSENLEKLLKKYGKISVFESPYTTFRGSRNLQNRDKHVTEFLYLLEKK